MKNMKILHLSKFYHPYRGGIEKVIKELAETAVREGHEVTVICSNERNRRSEEVIGGVRVIRLPKWWSIFSQPVTPTVFWELGKFLKAADVVHLHTPNPLFESACLMMPIKCPLIVTYHCEVMKARALNNLYRPISSGILERADKILVATRYHIQYSKWLHKYEHKCEIIPFGIEPKYGKKSMEINTELNAVKEKYGRYFLFVGRMVPYKGVTYLLDAMKHVDQNLVLIGKGPQLKKWKKLAAKSKFKERIHFIGGVESDEQFAAFLHGCDALVLPSINEAEAFGLALLEAMSCRKPLITTALQSGVRYVNVAGQTGLMVPPSDSLALAEAMNTLRGHDELRLKMGEAAFKHFNDNFLVTESFRRHHNVYDVLRKKIAA